MAEREAVAEKRSYSRLHHLEVHRVRGENGGFKVMHHRESEGMTYHPPQEHLFGKDEGREMIAHVARHMGVDMEHEQEGDEGNEED